MQGPFIVDDDDGATGGPVIKSDGRILSRVYRSGITSFSLTFHLSSLNRAFYYTLYRRRGLTWYTKYRDLC